MPLDLFVDTSFALHLISSIHQQGHEPASFLSSVAGPLLLVPRVVAELRRNRAQAYNLNGQWGAAGGLSWVLILQFINSAGLVFLVEDEGRTAEAAGSIGLPEDDARIFAQVVHACARRSAAAGFLTCDGDYEAIAPRLCELARDSCGVDLQVSYMRPDRAKGHLLDLGSETRPK